MSLYGREHGARLGGGGNLSEDLVQQQRRERLKNLTAEAFDLNRDPYLLKNHLGTFECKLCFTLHRTLESYALHTEAKKHKDNLQKRVIKFNKTAKNANAPATAPELDVKSTVVEIPRIGTPAYKLYKLLDKQTGAHSILFRIEYPKILEGMRPRYHIVSSYEQKVVPVSDKYQYIVFAAEPYEVIGFQVPRIPTRKDGDGAITHWNPETGTFTLQITFKDTYDSPYRVKAVQQTYTQESNTMTDNANPSDLWQSY